VDVREGGTGRGSNERSVPFLQSFTLHSHNTPTTSTGRKLHVSPTKTLNTNKKWMTLEYTVVIAKKELAFNIQILVFRGSKLCRLISYGLMPPYLGPKYRKFTSILISTPVGNRNFAINLKSAI
jgi:hypothetical protein